MATVRSAYPVSEFGKAAAIVTCPLARAVATPLPSIVAMFSFRLVQLIESDIALPFASCASAVNVCVAPTPERETPAGVTVTSAASCSTVMEAEPEMSSVVAVTVAIPFARAVTSPDEVTVAVFSSEDVQVNVLPLISPPWASRATAVI